MDLITNVLLVHTKLGPHVVVAVQQTHKLAGLAAPVHLVHTQPALNATALAPVTRKSVIHVLMEGLLTRVPVVNLSQELLALVEVLSLQLQLTKYEQLEIVATVLMKVELPRKHCAKRVQQPFLGRIRRQCQ